MTTHVFILGLERFQGPDSPFVTVPYAEVDARAVREAFSELGLPSGQIHLFLDAQATKTTVESRLKGILSGLEPTAALLFFYVGHVFSIEGGNYLACHDTQQDDLTSTSLSIAWLFERLRTARCRQVFLFLDGGHGGLAKDSTKPEKAERWSAGEFDALFSDSKQMAGFISCGPDEVSHASIPLGHGIWTYHVLRALRGEAPDALQEGRWITSVSLRDYLSVAVPRTLRTAVAAATVQQTPSCFGKIDAASIITDVRPIKDTPRETPAAETWAPRHAQFAGWDHGAIKNLSGFVQGLHKIPKSVTPATERFVQDIGAQELRDHTDKMHASLRSAFPYGVKDMEVSYSKGCAAIKARDFDVNIQLNQDQDEAKAFSIQTEVTNFRDPRIVATPEFNEAVGPFVSMLQLELSADWNLREMIDRLEKISSSGFVQISYSADLSDVSLRFAETGMTLRLRDGRCEVTSSRAGTPLELVEGLHKIQGLLGARDSAGGTLLTFSP